MERLTGKNKSGVWTAYKGDGSVSFSGEHVDKLAAYEDTGYAPDEIARLAKKGYDLRSLSGSLEELDAYRLSGLKPKEVMKLAAAKREGRLEILPCRVGDDFFVIIEHVTGRKSVTGHTCTGFNDKGILTGYNGFYPFVEIGKTVFFARAQAEAALEASLGEDA